MSAGKSDSSSLAKALQRIDKNPLAVLGQILSLFDRLQEERRQADVRARREKKYRHEAENRIAWVDGMLEALTKLLFLICQTTSLTRLGVHVTGSKPSFWSPE